MLSRTKTALSRFKPQLLQLKARYLHTEAAACLEAIQRLDDKLSAVVHTDPEVVNIPEDTAAKSSELPLQGMCVLVKDSIDVKGMPTVVGEKERVGNIATEDAPIVARLREAGAVMVGKTNVPVGCLDLQTFNDVFGVTKNPYDLSLTPGGSSGGSAAAVASGMVSLALGSDLSGSLRVPASFCGVASLRPTDKRVPVLGHTPPAYCHQNNLQMGAIADSSSTLNAFMQAASIGKSMGADGLPPVTWRHVSPPSPRDIRILLTTSLPSVPTQAAIVDAMEAFGEQLEGWGVQVVRTAPSLDRKSLFRAHKLFSDLCLSVAPSPGANPLVKRPGDVSPTAQQLAAAERVRDEHRLILNGFLEGGAFTAWVLPAAGVLPFAHNPAHEPLDVDGTAVPYWQPLLGYAFQASTCGNPVVSLPVGAQVIGRMWEDEELLALSSTLELLLAEPCPPPPIHVNRC